jgi:hypothetical protein
LTEDSIAKMIRVFLAPLQAGLFAVHTNTYATFIPGRYLSEDHGALRPIGKFQEQVSVVIEPTPWHEGAQ